MTHLEVHFSSEKLRKVLQDEKKILQKYGEKCGKKIKLRISNLRTAVNWEELKGLPGNWHPLIGDRLGQWASDLEQPKRLIVEFDGNYSKSDNGEVEHDSVTEVLVVEIVDYH